MMTFSCCGSMLILLLHVLASASEGCKNGFYENPTDKKCLPISVPNRCIFGSVYENEHLIFNWKSDLIHNGTMIENNNENVTFKYSLYYYGSSISEIDQIITTENENVIVAMTSYIYNYLGLNETKSNKQNADNNNNNDTNSNGITYVAWVATVAVIKKSNYELNYYSNYTFCNTSNTSYSTATSNGNGTSVLSLFGVAWYYILLLVLIIITIIFLFILLFQLIYRKCYLKPQLRAKQLELEEADQPFMYGVNIEEYIELKNKQKNSVELKLNPISNSVIASIVEKNGASSYHPLYGADSPASFQYNNNNSYMSNGNYNNQNHGNNNNNSHKYAQSAVGYNDPLKYKNKKNKNKNRQNKRNSSKNNYNYSKNSSSHNNNNSKQHYRNESNYSKQHRSQNSSQLKASSNDPPWVNPALIFEKSDLTLKGIDFNNNESNSYHHKASSNNNIGFKNRSNHSQNNSSEFRKSNNSSKRNSSKFGMNLSQLRISPNVSANTLSASAANTYLTNNTVVVHNKTSSDMFYQDSHLKLVYNGSNQSNESIESVDDSDNDNSNDNNINDISINISENANNNKKKNNKSDSNKKRNDSVGTENAEEYIPPKSSNVPKYGNTDSNTTNRSNFNAYTNAPHKINTNMQSLKPNNRSYNYGINNNSNSNNASVRINATPSIADSVLESESTSEMQSLNVRIPTDVRYEFIGDANVGGTSPTPFEYKVEFRQNSQRAEYLAQDFDSDSDSYQDTIDPNSTMHDDTLNDDTLHSNYNHHDNDDNDDNDHHNNHHNNNNNNSNNNMLNVNDNRHKHSISTIDSEIKKQTRIAAKNKKNEKKGIAKDHRRDLPIDVEDDALPYLTKELTSETLASPTAVSPTGHGVASPISPDNIDTPQSNHARAHKNDKNKNNNINKNNNNNNNEEDTKQQKWGTYVQKNITQKEPFMKIRFDSMQ